MDILIKNLKIPKEKYIRVEIHHDGTIYVQKNGYYSFYVKSQDKAIELPPHGELIERKKLIEDSLKAEAFLPNNEIVEWFQQKISSAPTVLEASNGTDN